jgi:DnaJ-class molecular chaperone
VSGPPREQPRDPWAVLELAPGSDEQAVKAAFRRLARLYHPDISTVADAATRFQEIQDAHKFLLAELEAQPTTPPGAAAGDTSADEIRISFLKAFTGGDVQIDLLQNGRKETFTVSVPAGVRSGMRLEARPLRGYGRTVIARVERSARYQREGDDLLIDLPITIGEACLGATVPVPGPGRELRLRIPPSTGSGRVFQVAGEGMPRLDGSGRGSLLVRIWITVPAKLTLAQERAIGEFARYETDPRAALS